MAIIDGTPNDDFLDGTPNDDTINGENGNDTLAGFAADDVLVGLDGDDVLNGGDGNDLLVGLSGDDVLDGGKGNDTLTGDSGKDIFILTDDEDYGTDTIADFVVGEDVIQLDGLSSGDAIAYDPQSGNLLSNGRIVAQLPTELTFESDSFDFDVDQSELTLDIPFANDDGNGGNNGVVNLDSFTFSNRSDVVEENNLILIPGGSFVSTLAGNDLIFSIYTTDTPTISGELGGIVPGIVGISQQEEQKISTGNGADEVIGEASGTATSDDGSLIPIVGIAKSNSTINTGNGADKVIGEANGTAGQIAGIVQQGSEDLIITENGNDEVIGTATGTAAFMAGIAQQPGTGGSQIITGKDNDRVIGTASNNGQSLVTAGILGDLDIVTGSGNDEVIASAQISGTRVDGFAADPFTGGAVTVDTGSGNDLVKGFGQGHFDGGKGNQDVYDLSEYSQSEFTIEIGAGGNNEVDFTHTDLFGESTASIQGFEVFRFADGELSFSDLA